MLPPDMAFELEELVDMDFRSAESVSQRCHQADKCIFVEESERVSYCADQR